jgi:hypothetical protein
MLAWDAIDDPGRAPVRRIVFRPDAVIGSTASSTARQNSGISDSAKMRSRDLVGFRSTPWHGLMAMWSLRTAQANTAEIAASTWLPRIGLSPAMRSRTSARVIDPAGRSRHRFVAYVVPLGVLDVFRC